MIDPKKVDFNQLPKKFSDGAVGAFNKDAFYFAITSGNTLDSFATTPQVMKSMAVWLSENVKNYENMYGEIDMNPPQIQSPIQLSDLGGTDKK